MSYLFIDAESIDKSFFGGKLHIAKPTLAPIFIW